MTIRLLTLGGLGSAVPGGELEWLASQWLRAAVLVHLTLERVVTRDALQAMFWPDNDSDTAGHRLSQTVYILRRALGEHAIETRGRELRAGTILDADALDFERAMNAERFADAMALYRGPFLDGVHLAPTSGYEMWVDGRRTQYARLFRRASREVVDAHLAAGDVAAAVAAAQAWVAPDPSDDEAQHRLIDVLARAGARTDALRQYEVYTRLLAADGLEPLDQTRELVTTIEQQTNLASFPADAAYHTETPPQPAAERERDDLGQVPPQRSWRSLALPTAVAVIGLAILSLAVAIRSSRTDIAPASGLDPPEPVAVLIFEDASDGGELAWLANGLTRSLIEALHGATGLGVRPFQAVWPYRDGRTPHPDIARSLTVAWLIGGNVAFSVRGDRIEVFAELIDGATGALIEPFTVRHEAGQELRLIEDVVEQVAERLQRLLLQRLGREVSVRRWSAETNAVAFQLLQQAADLVVRTDTVIETGGWIRAWQMLRQADGILADAAHQDPVWPEPAIQRAWVARDIAFLLFGNQAGGDSVGAALRRGLIHADTAVLLSNGGARALEVRGVLRYASRLLVPVDSLHEVRVLEDARADLEAATRIDSRLPRALNSLSSLHFTLGDMSGAARLAERAFFADSYLEDAPEIVNRLFGIRFEAGDDEQASGWCDTIGRRWPGSREHVRCTLKLMAWNPASSPDPGRSWRIVDEVMENTAAQYQPFFEPQFHLLVAGVLAKAGLADSARSVIARTRARAGAGALNLAAPTDGTLVLEEAAVRVLLGDTAGARRLLDENARILPSESRLHSSRRFASLY